MLLQIIIQFIMNVNIWIKCYILLFRNYYKIYCECKYFK